MKIAGLIIVWLCCGALLLQKVSAQQPTPTAKPTPTPGSQEIRTAEAVVPLPASPQAPPAASPTPLLSYEPKSALQIDSAGEYEGPGFSFTYLPPLSIYDSIHLMRRCIDLLERNTDRFVELRKEKVREALTDVIEYIKTVDQAHSLLAYYKWYFVGRNKVSLGEQIDEDTYDVEPVLKGATAISFSAERGDVYVHRMKVIDAEGRETNFKIDKWIDSGLPRREICYLFFQTDVARIFVNHSARRNESPRLSLYVGVTPMPEYAKEAIYYLAAARKATQEGNLPEAVENIRQAWIRLLKYKLALRL